LLLSDNCPLLGTVPLIGFSPIYWWRERLRRPRGVGRPSRCQVPRDEPQFRTFGPDRDPSRKYFLKWFCILIKNQSQSY